MLGPLGAASYNPVMDKPGKPSLGFWVTVVCLSSLVLYPLSFGPACWINQRSGIGSRAILIGYRPIIWISENTGAAGAIVSYASLGASADVRPVFLDADIQWVGPQFWEVYRMIGAYMAPFDSAEFIMDESESVVKDDSQDSK
jgi:hypothetical protein